MRMRKGRGAREMGGGWRRASASFFGRPTDDLRWTFFVAIHDQYDRLRALGLRELQFQHPTEQFLLGRNHTDSVVRERISNLCPGVVKLTLI